MADPDEDLDVSPREILTNLIQQHYPVDLYEEYTETDESGKVVTKIRKVKDADGNNVQNPDAVAARDALIKKVKDSLNVPDSPLDQILNYYGRDSVAELTGRTHIIRRGDTGAVEKIKRAPEKVAART